MKVPLLDLKKQFDKIKQEVMSAMEALCDAQQFILGSCVEELEAKVAAYCGCRYAVGVSSGTDALLVSLMTADVGAGDLVLTSPYTFFATAGSIARVGATPVFVDIDEDTYNLDPAKLEEKIQSMGWEQRSRLKAIIPVHLYGQCAEMEPILKVAADCGLQVIEDAAQAIGSEYEFRDGKRKRAGSMGEYGCFSFFPSKNLGAFGDAGMVTTNREDIYYRLKIMRSHGASPKYYHKVIGGNFRLDALQAAVLLVKLKYLEDWTTKRVQNARRYRELFREAGVEDICLPLEKAGRHIYNQFVIRVGEKRDELRAFLSERGIGTEIYYPVPLHMQECFRYLNYGPEDLSVSAKAAATSLALPIYPELTDSQIVYVVGKISEYGGRR